MSSKTNPLGHKAFQLAMCQASLFTPEEGFSTASLLAQLYAKWAPRFDAEPVLLPSAEGIPPEIPRLIMQDRTEAWRCEAGPLQLNIYWRRTLATTTTIALTDFIDWAVPALMAYSSVRAAPVTRLGFVIGRFAEVDEPGIALSRHFCKEQWYAAPLNRPEHFELHAHKRFLLDNWLDVNSWARSRTAMARLGDRSVPAVLFEQDINTPPQVDDRKEWVPTDLSTNIERFFKCVGHECDTILRLYYPNP